MWVGGSGWRRTAASGEADGAHAHAAATQPTESETRACARRATQASHLQLLAISSLLFGRPVGQHTITNDQACDQEGGQHFASASRLMGNAAVKCSDAAVRQRTEDTERGARLETYLARLMTSSKLLSRSTRTRRFTNVHLWRFFYISAACCNEYLIFRERSIIHFWWQSQVRRSSKFSNPLPLKVKIYLHFMQTDGQTQRTLIESC